MASLFLILGALIHNDKLNWQITRKEVEFYSFLAVMWMVSYFFGLGMHEETFKFMVKMTKLFICIFFICRIVHTYEDFNLIIATFIFGAAFLGYQAHASGDFSTGRIDNIGGSDFAEANAFATFMLVGASMLGYKIIRLKLWQTVPAVLIIAMMLNAFVLARSRGALVGILFATPFAMFNMPKKYRLKVSLFVVLGAILFFNLMDEGFLERMETIQTESQAGYAGLQVIDSENLTRLDFWRTSIDIFRDHPMGIGSRNFESTVTMYDPRNPGFDAHNTIVLCYTEFGVVGISIFFLIFFETYLELRRIKKMAQFTQNQEYINLNLISISTILIIYAFGSILTHSYVYIEILWLFLTLPMCLEKATKNMVSFS